MDENQDRRDFWLARGAAVLGTIAFLGNLLGVVVLGDIPQAYKPGQLEIWLSDSLAHPDDAIASALYFTFGVLVMVPFGMALTRLVSGPLSGLAVLGGAFIATGALMNGSATMALNTASIVAGLAVMPMTLEASYDWAAQWVLWGSVPLLVWLLGLAWRAMAIARTTGSGAVVGILGRSEVAEGERKNGRGRSFRKGIRALSAGSRFHFWS